MGWVATPPQSVAPHPGPVKKHVSIDFGTFPMKLDDFSTRKRSFSRPSRWNRPKNEIPEMKFNDFDNSASSVCLILTASTDLLVPIGMSFKEE